MVHCLLRNDLLLVAKITTEEHSLDISRARQVSPQQIWALLNECVPLNPWTFKFPGKC